MLHLTRREKPMTARFLLLLGAMSLVLTGTGWALQGHDVNFDYPPIPFDHKAIQYMEQLADGPVARLERRMEKGEVKLEFDPKWGYLRSVLNHLGINIDSQVLVFSQTSFRASQVSPARPRAIYFNDSVSVAHVQDNPVLEVASLDPKQGIVFYTLDVRQSDAPGFHRLDMTCLQCHMGPATLNIPGIVVSSVQPSPEGSPFTRAFATDHRIPLAERWGGWYVTGAHSGIAHRGKAVADSSQAPDGLAQGGSQTLPRLDEFVDTSSYLAASSDIVALMTLEHQTRITNLITRIGWETRVAAEDGKLEEFRPRLGFLVDEMVTYMLFADEAPVQELNDGDSAFRKTFPQRGPRDSQGRSLRDFDLQERLFRYPLSFMVYSEAFEKMPEIAREEVLRALYDVLTGKGKDEEERQKFARLSAEDRRVVLEILRDTKPHLPAYWRGPASVQ